jgi:hypothetical protein
LEIADIGPTTTNAWHTAYLYARNDGKVKLWWDGNLFFDGTAPLVNPYHGYVEWGSGAWQYNATTTVDFDWVAYGDNF